MFLSVDNFVVLLWLKYYFLLIYYAVVIIFVPSKARVYKGIKINEQLIVAKQKYIIERVVLLIYCTILYLSYLKHWFLLNLLFWFGKGSTASYPLHKSIGTLDIPF